MSLLCSPQEEEVLPHIPPPDRWVHGAMISLPPRLARRRGGLSAGQDVISLLVTGWVSSACVRAAVCVARVGPALAGVGYCECSVHYLLGAWAQLPQPPCYPETRSSSIQGHPQHLQTGCH